jgi:CRP-like cAMP-binding protein
MYEFVHTFPARTRKLFPDPKGPSMPNSKPWKPGNRLLAGLAPEIRARLKEEFVTVEMPVGKLLFEPDSVQAYVYFPLSGLVSLLAVLENGDTGEVAMVGKEGLVGVSLLVDSQSTPTRAVVQVAGEALALRAETMSHEFRLAGGFQMAMLRYTQALIAQITQVSMCTRRHTVERQLCRWLLLAFDRVEDGELTITHEAIAHLIGVRREGVTEAAGRLQSAGLIRYSRGRMHLQDREGLVQRGCECYLAIRREYARLLDAPLE